MRSGKLLTTVHFRHLAMLNFMGIFLKIPWKFAIASYGLLPDVYYSLFVILIFIPNDVPSFAGCIFGRVGHWLQAISYTTENIILPIILFKSLNSKQYLHEFTSQILIYYQSKNKNIALANCTWITDLKFNLSKISRGFTQDLLSNLLKFIRNLPWI